MSGGRASAPFAGVISAAMLAVVLYSSYPEWLGGLSSISLAAMEPDDAASVRWIFASFGVLQGFGATLSFFLARYELRKVQSRYRGLDACSWLLCGCAQAYLSVRVLL